MAIKKIITTLVALALVAGIFAGCGGGNSGAGNANNASGAANTNGASNAANAASNGSSAVESTAATQNTQQDQGDSTDDLNAQQEQGQEQQSDNAAQGGAEPDNTAQGAELDNATSNNAASTNAAQDSAAQEYDGGMSLRIAAEPTTITLFSAYGADGMLQGDMPIWVKAAEITGVSMQNVANPSISEAAESFNAMLASGSLPDIIGGMDGELMPIVSQGGFIALDDLIDQHGPNIRNYFETIPDARVASTAADGNKYYIEGSLSPTSGSLAGALIPTMTWFIRTDWLDKLGLKAPTTFDELEAVLYAFRNSDPNGNGEKDEIPFFFRNGSPVGLYQFFGVDGDWANWAIDEETDSVVFGRITENYKNALRKLTQWYKDGIIDPEILSRGSQARQELLGNDIGGMTFDWYESTANMNYNEDILNIVPDLQFLPIMPPADIRGRVRNVYSQAPVSGYAWGISKDCKDPVTAIKYMDFWFSDVGSMLATYGIEGLSYYMVGGKPEWSDEARAYGAGIPNYMRSIGAAPPACGVKEVDNSLKTEIAQQAYTMYFDSDCLVAPFPTFSFDEEEEAILADNWGAIDTLWGQYEQQVLYGEKDVDASWAGYLAEMDALGMQEVLAAYNSAYIRYKEEFGN